VTGKPMTLLATDFKGRTLRLSNKKIEYLFISFSYI